MGHLRDHHRKHVHAVDHLDLPGDAGQSSERGTHPLHAREPRLRSERIAAAKRGRICDGGCDVGGLPALETRQREEARTEDRTELLEQPVAPEVVADGCIVRSRQLRHLRQPVVHVLHQGSSLHGDWDARHRHGAGQSERGGGERRRAQRGIVGLGGQRIAHCGQRLRACDGAKLVVGQIEAAFRILVRWLQVGAVGRAGTREEAVDAYRDLELHRERSRV